MKICYLADSESIHTKRWCEHFLEKDYEVSLISFKQQCSIKGIDFYPIDAGKVSVKGGNWKVLLQYKKIQKLIKTIQPDILHAHYATSYGVVGALAKFHPYIITALGTDILISPSKSIIYRILLKFAFKRADWITIMADHMEMALGNLGNFKSKTDVVPFGINTTLFNAKKRQLDKSRFVITSTRNFEDVYNIPHLLKAVAKTKENIPNLQLNLIGDGSKRNEIEEMVMNLGLDAITTFYGRIPQSTIVEILNQSHIFASVSLSDGNNISLNEAMACGTFPIVTDIPANKQWIEEGDNGFVVNINDVDSLAKKIELSFLNFEELSKKAYQINQNIISEKADWNKNMKKVADKYQKLAYGK